MNADLDFFSVKTNVSSLELNPWGYSLASSLVSKLRDERVLFAKSGAVQITCDPFVVFAVVERERLQAELARVGIHICLSEGEEVLCAEGRLHVDSEALVAALTAAGCDHVICYQFGLKSTGRSYWAWVHRLAQDFPDCVDNVFHISRNFDGLAEDGSDHVCLFMAATAPGFRVLHNFPLFKHLGHSYGGCKLLDNHAGVSVNFYPRIGHVLKRHRISSMKIPNQMQAGKTFLKNLVGFRARLNRDEREHLHGYRMELECRGNSPYRCHERFQAMLDPQYWIAGGCLSVKTLEVESVLDVVDEALQIFIRLRVVVGDTNKVLTLRRREICTDLLNFFGVCRPSMMPHLARSGSVECPFHEWEYSMANEAALVNRIGRKKVKSRKVVARSAGDGEERSVSRYQRNRSDEYTGEQDELIKRAAKSKSNRKWVDVISSNRELFRGRTAGQLKDRNQYLKNLEAKEKRATANRL
jgi:hypothetical protein